MPERYLEENRYLFVQSRLGPNELLLESFTGTEGISRLFCFQLELLSENKRIRFEDILGQEISFGVLGAEDREPPRYMHGIVTAFTQLPDTARLSRYRAIVSPKLWILTQKQDCRIFQSLSVPDIIKKVLQEMGIDAAFELNGDHPVREYCVQYRETDFNFVSRLMEEEGIFYYFRFAKNTHKLVISDANPSLQDMPGQATLIYDEVAGGLRDEARVSSWIKTQELGPGKCSLRDHNFEMPTKSLEVDEPSTVNVGGNASFEIYDYPGFYEKEPDGRRIVRIAMERRETSEFIIEGESNIYYLTPGYRYELTKHPNAAGFYVLTSITHSASEGGFHSAKEIGQNHYANSFRSIPFSSPFRPPHTASKSHIWGCQTAVVVGPSGEEIYTDKYGRVKVQFHWDRLGKKDDKSSCWIRVSTSWAGKNWGAIHIPRIGQEVVVDFLEGDPDRPIVVGSVYNGENNAPYTLPDNKTQSGFKSRSSKGGASSDRNEIRFEDLKGKEEVFLHAQKDMNTTVEHDETLAVKHDETINVSNNRTTKVGNDDTASIGNNMTLTVTKDRSATVGGNDSLTVAKSSTVTIASSESITIGSSRTTSIAASDTLTAGGSVTITASGLTITAPTIVLNAAVVQVTGVVQCTNMIASAGVVSPVYSPGAGNIW